jgi:hypothetical protein
MWMKTLSQWWYNGEFDDLMADVDEWLAENDGIQVVHMDWKYIQFTDAPHNNRWYMIMLYKPPG